MQVLGSPLTLMNNFIAPPVFSYDDSAHRRKPSYSHEGNLDGLTNSTTSAYKTAFTFQHQNLTNEAAPATYKDLKKPGVFRGIEANT
jgi:hypothetical protein